MVRIDGATGVHSGRINGFYEPIEEIVGRASVYRKVDDADTWIEYFESSGKWFLKSTSSRGKNIGFARASISPPKPLEECPLSCWQVHDGTNWVVQSSLTVSTVTLAALEVAKVMYMVWIDYTCMQTLT